MNGAARPEVVPPDAAAALEVLRSVVQERDTYRDRYERAVDDLVELQRRYDDVVDALRTLRSAGSEVPDTFVHQPSEPR